MNALVGLNDVSAANVLKNGRHGVGIQTLGGHDAGVFILGENHIETGLFAIGGIDDILPVGSPGTELEFAL